MKPRVERVEAMRPAATPRRATAARSILALAPCAFALLALPTVRGHAEEARAWTDRIRISGSADLGFFGGGRQSVESDDGFDVWDTRLFVDADLGEDVELGGRPMLRNLGFTFEWNIARLGTRTTDVGLAYLDLEGLGRSPWLNLRVGRFQVPFGEAYKLYSKGYAGRSFVTQPVGGPWWWDEGILLHGTAPSDRFGYVASLTNGDTDFNDVGGDYQLTAKLWAQPFAFLYVSASGLFTSALEQVDGALWLGEGWPRPFGSGTPLTAHFEGAPVAADPDGLGHVWAVALDVVITPLDGVRIWLAGGRVDLPSQGASRYDRALAYGLGEIVLGGQLVSPGLKPLFVGLRVDGVGTFDDGRGYLLDVRYTGDYGYDMVHLLAYTAVAGWRLGDYVTFRMEYSHRDVDLVRGAVPDLPGRTGNEDLYSVEFGLHF
ncbi:MAG: hypothetical protein R3F35_01735 [Myxococcota bacterium]